MYKLYVQAADAAMRATINFIDSIRSNPDDAINDDDFYEFLGLTLGKTLCFVIDTTGSMASEIAAIQAVTSAIVAATLPAAGGETPGDYLVVPFNDPGLNIKYLYISVSRSIYADRIPRCADAINLLVVHVSEFDALRFECRTKIFL